MKTIPRISVVGSERMGLADDRVIWLIDATTEEFPIANRCKSALTAHGPDRRRSASPHVGM
jgi:hypothetical protein